jgi:uncharacterized protein YycO
MMHGPRRIEDVKKLAITRCAHSQKARLIDLMALMAFLMISASASISAQIDSDQFGVRLAQEDVAILRDGDLIFRKAPGMASDYIVAVDGKSEYSHVGLIHKEDERVTVIHSAFDKTQLNTGVHEEDLSSFLTGIPLAAIYRLLDDTGSRANEAAQMALDLVGTPFDFNLNKDDAQQLYCTELLWVVYRRAGIELLDNQPSELDLPMLGHRQVILPSDLAGSSKLFQVMHLKIQP